MATDFLMLDLDTPLPLTMPCPEARFSTNSRVEIAGTTHQVTARGNTPQEMAEGFREAVQALRDVLETPTAPSREAQVATLQAAWLAKAVTLGDLGKAQRVLKAAQLVLAGKVRRGDTPALWYVDSQCDDTLSYALIMVERSNQKPVYTCACKDYEIQVQSNEEHLCKHGLSVAMHNKLF